MAESFCLQAFIRNIQPGNKEMKLVKLVLDIAKNLGVPVVAEGVETVEQAEILVEKGVEYLQGFYYSRPIPENEYIEFLKAQKGERQ